MTGRATSGTNHYLQILSNHNDDSHPALAVVFDHQRYLFNAPESLCRIAIQSRIPLKRISQVFLGGIGEQTAGLPGLILSSAEAGNKSLNLIGPQGLHHFVATCRTFTRREQVSLSITTVPPLSTTAINDVTTLPEPIHSDENIIVYPFPSTSSLTPPSKSTAPSLKRRRNSTSPSTSPRIAPTPVEMNLDSTTLISDLAPLPHQPILDITAPGFDPSILVGDQAVEWRRLVIADMFRGGIPPPPPPTFTRNPSPPLASTSTSTPQPRYNQRTQTPSYLPAALPRLDPIPQRTALSYLVVGPALRGEFLGAEAIKRGVRPGPNFARLVRGERIWVPLLEEEVEIEVAPSLAVIVEASTSTSTSTMTGKQKAAATKEANKVKAIQDRERSSLKAAAKAKKKAQLDREAAIPEGVGPGHWVASEDCVGPGEDGTAFLVLNIPSIDHLDSLLASLPAARFTTIMHAHLKAIYYFLGPGVLHDVRLTNWISTLPPLDHRISSADLIQSSNPVLFAPAALLALRLNELSPDIFRLPHYSFLPELNTKDHDLLPPAFPKNSTITRLLERTYLGSKKTPTPAANSATTTTTTTPTTTSATSSDERHFNFLVPSAEAKFEAGKLKSDLRPDDVILAGKETWEQYLVAAAQVKLAVSEKEMSLMKEGKEVKVGDDLRVTPLGTGSAVPSKYRNVSSTLIHLPQDGGYILLDAGEGTWGQIARRFGKEGEGGKEEEESSERILRELKCVFISHMHQDHHMGLATVLRKRSQLVPLPTDPLTIIAPPGIRQYLMEQQPLFDVGVGWPDRNIASNVKFVDSYAIEFGKPISERHVAFNTINDLGRLLGMKSIATVPVLHRCRCWGISIEHESGWKIVFSGDTMPCEALVRAGEGATLLIHEATIEDELPEVAAAKGHSTFKQAIDIARRMKAKYCLLTHFSARYPKLPPLADPLDAIEGTTSQEPIVAIAFDMATLRLDEFWKMEEYREAMTILFREDDEGDDI